MWVTMTRRIGRPSSSLAKTCSHCAFDASVLMQQSTTLQPGCPSISSRNSHRLIWFSANGNPMRNHFTPAATVRLAPGPGRAGSHHFGQPFPMVLMQLFNAFIKTNERFAMRGQGQRLGVEQAELVDRIQELFERIRFRLLIVDADVGGDAWQHHVAANQQPQLLTIQGDMLWRVAIAADAAPLPRANGQHLAVL